MTHRLQHIPDMADILFELGVRDVVISPGSRNAPLTAAFFERFKNGCKSIVDERSAGYFALGQSLKSKLPTVLISTSGTAALNYAPAVAEAFYQKVPLLIITADRPPEWIGQQDNQAIQQNNIFEKNIKASYTLPTNTSENESLWFTHRTINEAYYLTISNSNGPVHINVPIPEPLYGNLPEVSKTRKIIIKEDTDFKLTQNSNFLLDWEKATSIMIIAGQLRPNKKVFEKINQITKDPRVIVVAEPISNLHVHACIASPDVLFSKNLALKKEELPDLVIYFGGQVISKKLKLFLRNLTTSKFYSISTNSKIVDTFKNIHSFIESDIYSILNSLPIQEALEKSSFKKFWEKLQLNIKNSSDHFFDNLSFSDLSTFKIISDTLPEEATIFAGNSSVVRYLSYFNQQKRKFYSNRGTSGIDGCLSTAAGLASKSKEKIYAIVGDLSFIYDSNALWNRELPQNLKIILINNKGGGIFHLIDGPSETKTFIPFFNAHHPVDFKKLTEAFGLGYQLCKSEKEIKELAVQLEQSVIPEVLEIQTPNNGEPQITKDFFQLFK